MKFKKGQVWKTPKGNLVTIGHLKENSSFPVRGTHLENGKPVTRDYTGNGHFLCGGFSDREFDLVELVSDVGRWWYGTSDENMNEGPCDTLEEAKQDAHEHFLENEEECDTYYLAEAKPYELNLSLADELLEKVVETVADEVFEPMADRVEEVFKAVSELDKDKLNTEINTCLKNWLKKHCPDLDIIHFPGNIIHEQKFRREENIPYPFPISHSFPH